MRVAEIDLDDDDAMRAFWEAGKEALEFQRPYEVYWSLAAQEAAYRSQHEAIRRPLAAFDDDGTVVGICPVNLPRLDNTHIAYVHPSVRPAYRRRGIGSQLLDCAIDLARDNGRRTVIAEVVQPIDGDGPGASAGSALMAKHGFTVGSLDLHRILDLPTDDVRLDELAASAAPHHREYTFVAVDDRVPDDLMAGYCRLQEAFNTEAPMGDLDVEAERWDAERVRAYEARSRAAARRERRTVALTPDGTVVGLTEMMTTDHNTETAWQSGTLVLKEHRGRRLGLGLKVANLRRFEADFPDVRMVHSWNAEQNGPMVAINDQLGFVPVEYLAEMQLKL